MERLRTVALSVLVLVVVLGACGDDDSGSPTVAPGTPETSPSSLPTASGTPSPSPDPSPTPAIAGEMVVLASPGGTVVGDDGYSVYSEISVQVWDSGTGAAAMEYTIDGPLDIATPAWLNGHELWVHRPERLDLHDFDGDFVETLIEVEPGRRLLGAALSHDGRYLAYVEAADGALTRETIADTRLVITEVVSGGESGETMAIGDIVVEVEQEDQRLAEAVGPQLSDVFWNADNSYVVVKARAQGDSPPWYVVVHLDGEVFVPAAAEQRGVEVEPFGRAAVTGFQYLGSPCSPAVDKDDNRTAYGLGWVDLGTGENLGGVRVEQSPYAALWSPDGDEVMFAVADCNAGTETPGEAWYRWAPEGSAESVDDPAALYQDWFGERAVLVEQADGDILLPHGDPWRYVLSQDAEAAHFLFGDTALTAFPAQEQVWFLGHVK